jgi:hypothetical protein
MNKKKYVPPQTPEEKMDQIDADLRWNAYDDGCWRDDGPPMPKPKAGPVDWSSIQTIIDLISDSQKETK